MSVEKGTHITFKINFGNGNTNETVYQEFSTMNAKIYYNNEFPAQGMLNEIDNCMYTYFGHFVY